MTTTTQGSPIPTYTCPDWCTDSHTIGNCREDVLHMSDMAATSIPRYLDKGWIEFMAFLGVQHRCRRKPADPSDRCRDDRAVWPDPHARRSAQGREAATGSG
ncbi:hypothetical protein [Nocardia sp. XZ_19_369]|uniref:DUF6907 domain-containing protein n=1 Tax=Nocardia sp. XZ_19_369 TaxID=2769487 RepID=UPI0035A27F71